MGLFSKKTLVCDNCGKEYETRISLGRHVCPECAERERQKENEIKGYVDYANRMGIPRYTEKQMDQIMAHRQSILEKYRNVNGISKAELTDASENYKKLTEEQAEAVMLRARISLVHTTSGAAYTNNFFVLTNFEKTIVDANDVFAVGYTSDSKIQVDGQEVILCAVFTNDPYIPVFPMVYIGKLGFFEMSKSKKGREEVAERFEVMCPNLTYPVQDLKQLKKQIKSDGAVKGNMDAKFMLDRINDATMDGRIFNTKELRSTLDYCTTNMMDEYGYIQDDEINSILKMDKMFNRKFWEKQISKLLN